MSKIARSIYKEVKGFFGSLVNWRENAEQAYYAAATDHADLERRMRNVQYGRAPWQTGMWS